MLHRLSKISRSLSQLKSVRHASPKQVRTLASGVERSYSSQHHKQGSEGNHDHQNVFHTGGVATTVLSLLAALGLYTILSDDDLLQPTLNCGIVAVVGNDSTDASKYLIEGLTILRNRGYDSAGLASIDNNSKSLTITKYASQKTTSDSIDLVKADMALHQGHSIGIAHTRWATHGGKTDENAHPHTDSLNRIALVHNGTINNSFELKKMLRSKHGIHFKSETDTEVIAHLIGLGLDEGKSLRDSLQQALGQCEGSWGIACIHKERPKEIVVACNGSPMTIGLAEDKTFIASETSAFSRYTKSYVSMQDGEIGVICAEKGIDKGIDLSSIKTAPENDVLLTPAPYPHFTLKELLEQPEAIARAIGYGARMKDGNTVVLGGLDTNIDVLATTHNMLLSGCGTSKYAAEFGSKIMRDLGCFDTVQVMDSAEVGYNDLPRHKGVMLAVSQSGETKDVIRSVKIAQEVGLPVLSICNVVGSAIARTTGMGVYLNAGREHAVASTKAFSTQVTVMALVALWFRQTRESRDRLPESMLKREMMSSLQRLPICFGMGLRSRAACKAIARDLQDKHSIFLLGKGYGEPIAMEGALKLKEMCYVHAEGYSGGALKHGPFALIEGAEGGHGNTPVFCIILDDKHSHQMRTAAEEVRARGAKVYVITDKASLADGIDEHPILISNNGPLTALGAVLPLQMVAYELSVLKGINPDTPRNLAKAVTTD